MQIRECMKREVVSVFTTSTLDEAARTLVEKHVGLLPVTDDSRKLMGVIGLSDLLALSLPSFVKLIDDLDFVRDFGALENVRVNQEMLARQVSEVMREPISVLETTGLLRAYTMMLQHRLHDLPVVTPDGTLVGIASRVDIGTAFLADWETDLLRASGKP